MDLNLNLNLNLNLKCGFKNADLKSQDLRKNKKQNNLGIKNPVSKILLFNVLF